MNLTKSLLKLIGCCSLIALLSGCASVICGPKQAVAIDSKPHGAEVLVYDSHCNVIFQQATPCVAKLPRRTADYDKANYVVLIKKEGYAPVQIPLTGEVNKAYFANILFGGVGLAIDPIIGGMWTLTPDAIDPKVVNENAAGLTQAGFLVSLKEADTAEPAVALARPAALDQQLQQALAQQSNPATTPEAALQATPEVAQDSKPATPEATQEAKPSAPEATQEAKPAAPETAEGATPTTPQAKQATPETEQQTKDASADVAQQAKPDQN